MTDNKKQFGQFFTVNSDYILKNLSKYIKNKKVTDPFAGRGDLMNWSTSNGAKSIIGYEIDEKYIDNKTIFLNDAIKNPTKYEFVIMNPPYLNINKADKKTKDIYFKNSDFEDLYQLSLNSIMKSDEGIIIVPINFLSARNSKKIRNKFFSKFSIIEMNYFKQQVFPDTTYNVIAFYYKKKDNQFENKFKIKTHIYPENKSFVIELQKNHDWSIGGQILNIVKKQQNKLGIYRLMEDDIKNHPGSKKIKAAYNHVNTKIIVKVDEDIYKKVKNNIILLKAIDGGKDSSKIALEDVRKYDVDCLISKISSRHMIYLIFNNKISFSDQQKIIKLFNMEIQKLRDEYLSLFLTNYRDNDRKRISFEFVYKFINYLYFNYVKKEYGKHQTLNI